MGHDAVVTTEVEKGVGSSRSRRVAVAIGVVGLWVLAYAARAAVIGMDVVTAVFAIAGFAVFIALVILGAVAYDRRRSRRVGPPESGASA